MTKTAATTVAARAYWTPFSSLAVIRLSGEETGGALSLVEFLIPAGNISGPHAHREATQTMYVLEGEVTMHVHGRSTVVKAGDAYFIPAGVPHSSEVTSDIPARTLDVNVPAGFEGFLTAFRPAETLTLPPPLADQTVPYTVDLIAHAEANGMVVYGAAGTPPPPPG